MGDQQTKIISVHAANAGMGVSTILANVAVQVALQGYRVLIIDMNLRDPALLEIFGKYVNALEYTLNDFLAEKCSIEEIVYPVQAMEYQGNIVGEDFYLIPASTQIDAVSKLIREGYEVNRYYEDLKDLLKDLRPEYVLIDAGPGLQEEALLIMADSNISLVVLSLARRFLQRAFALADVAGQLEVEAMLVVNKFLDRYDRIQVKEEFETALGLPVAGLLPLSQALTEFEIEKSGVFSLAYPDDPWSTGILEIASTIL